MCGITGVMGLWLTNTEKDAFKDLLTVSNLRGWQGAGVIVSSNQGDVDVFKTVESGTTLAHDYDFNQRLFHSKPVKGVSVLIGHTRWPTKGAITLEATHPHEHDGIVGVHNGTLDRIGDHRIGKDESDSSLLYQSFAEKGVKDTIEDTSGAYCLVWIDKVEKTVNFLRNDKRPLYYAVSSNGQTLWWASERGMLEFVLNRRGIKYEILTLVVDRWCVYDLPLKSQLQASHVAELKGAAPVVAATHPFLDSWRGTTSWTRTGTGGQAAIEEGAKESAAAGKTGAVTTSGASTTPLLPKPQTQQGILPQTKPRMRWSNEANTWVEITPTSTPTTTKTISLGGSGKTQSNEQVKEVPQSTEGTFCGPVLRDDEVVGERDFSAGKLTGPQDISEAVKELFDEATILSGYRETTDNNWVSQEQYLKFLEKGCLWCGDPQPDVKDHLWTDVDELLCFGCQSDQFAQEYACLTLGKSAADLVLPKIKYAA